MGVSRLILSVYYLFRLFSVSFDFCWCFGECISGLMTRLVLSGLVFAPLCVCLLGLFFVSIRLSCLIFIVSPVNCFVCRLPRPSTARPSTVSSVVHSGLSSVCRLFRLCSAWVLVEPLSVACLWFGWPERAELEMRSTLEVRGADDLMS
jgi:hypothetical protein